jgi:hypothetical protein
MLAPMVRRVALFLSLVLAVGLPARAAQAQDRFEIQVYDSTTAPVLGAGLELHVNHVFEEVHETHVTFEPHLGVLPWLEVGGYLQTAVLADGTLDYAGVKLRAKVRSPERYWGGRVGLALNGEISAVPSRYEEDTWGSELRPIADLEWDWLYVSVNPIVTFTLAGAEAGHPVLEPCAKVAFRVAGPLAIGAEVYSVLGPVDALGDGAVFRLLGAIDWSNRWLDLNVAAGWATGTEDRWVAKLIIGVHPPEP